MKIIEVDEELYRYIASHTQHIGESASDILRRLLNFNLVQAVNTPIPMVETQAAIPENTIEAHHTHDPVRVMRELLLSDEYAKQNTAVSRFLLILATLYPLDTSAFSHAAQVMQGRTRIYFAKDKQTLLANGMHTKPKQITDTPYWVITNTNTDRKRAMVEHIMQTMQLPTQLIIKICESV